MKPYETVPLANALEPHPEHHIAGRITEMEYRAFPDVIVWNPLRSISGKWEAVGDGWTIIEESPVAFADKLAARLGA